jgi:hypothetical protein
VVRLDDERFHELIRRVLRHGEEACRSTQSVFDETTNRKQRNYYDEHIAYDLDRFIELTEAVRKELLARENAAAVERYEQRLALVGPGGMKQEAF